MIKPLISVIIPCFNQAQYLQDTIDSVLASTYLNFEIIVINDGSTKTAEFLKSFSAPKTRVFHQENLGPSLARNSGIEKAVGKYILPLDADDKIYPEYIEKAVNILENDMKIGIVYCQAEFFGSKVTKWDMPPYKFPNCLWDNVIFNSAIFRKSDWQKVGGYKKEMSMGFEDWEFWISLIETGSEVYQIPEILFSYRQTVNSRNTKLISNKNITIMIKQIIKLHPNLYADNIEHVLLPLYKNLKYFSSRHSRIARFKYKILRIICDFLIKFY